MRCIELLETLYLSLFDKEFNKFTEVELFLLLLVRGVSLID